MSQIVPLLLTAIALTACNPSQPTDTVESLTADPDRVKEIQRLCKEERSKVNDQICLRAAEAAKRRFFGDRRESKAQ